MDKIKQILFKKGKPAPWYKRLWWEVYWKIECWRVWLGEKIAGRSFDSEDW